MKQHQEDVNNLPEDPFELLVSLSPIQTLLETYVAIARKTERVFHLQTMYISIHEMVLINFQYHQHQSLHYQR